MNQKPERRDYFRMNDQVHLEVIAESNSPAEQLSALKAQKSKLSDTLEKIQRLEREHASLMGNLTSKDRNLSMILNLQNQKIQCFLSFIVDLHRKEVPLTEVNLSGNGIKWRQPEQLNQEHYLLRVTLFPSAHQICCRIKLLENNQDTFNQYEITAEFVDIDAFDQDMIVKHLTQRQSQQLRVQAFQ